MAVFSHHGRASRRLQLERSMTVQQRREYCSAEREYILQVGIRFIHFESYSIIFLPMYKFFTLALLLLSFSSLSFAAIDDTQVIDREETTADSINLQRFTSCEAMDTVLTKYFKSALLEQIAMHGTPVAVPDSPESSINPQLTGTPGGEKGGMGGG